MLPRSPVFVFAPFTEEKSAAKHGEQAETAAPANQDSSASPYADPSTLALTNLVRVAISCAGEGRSGLEFEREVTRYQIAGALVGQSLHSRHFFRECVYVADLVLSMLDAQRYDAALPGLGIPSDVTLLLDGVSLGYGRVARNDTVLMMAFHMVAHNSGKLHSPMVGAPTLPVGGHSGGPMRDIALHALLSHPGQYDLAALRSRLALVGGDGAVCRGGESAQHQSSACAEKIWAQVHPEAPFACTEWDQFHRDDLGIMKALRGSPPVTNLFDCVAAINSAFGIGDGRSIMRGAAAFLGEHHGELQAAGGTRKVNHMCRIPRNLIKNYKCLSLALHARMEWRRMKHGTFSLQTLNELARQLHDVAFVSFLVMFSDIASGPLLQHAQCVQECSESWVAQASDKRLMRELASLQEAFEHAERLLLVTLLCCQHLAPQDSRVTQVFFHQFVSCQLRGNL